MTDLVEFLRARLDEDEEQARTAIRGMPSDPAPVIISVARVGDGPVPPALMIYQHPERELREVEAKRRIIELHRSVRKRSTGSGGGTVEDCAICDHFPATYPCATLRLLTLPYADHPDYRKEWRP